MTGGLLDARAAIVAELVAAGYRVATTPAAVNPPCVLVELPERIAQVTGCGYRAVLPVVALAPPPGGDEAAAWLLPAVEQLLGLLGATGAEPDRRDVAGLTLPGYRLDVPIAASSATPGGSNP